MNIAIVLAGGTGSRMGLDMPKQYIKVNDRPIISYCIDTLTTSCHIDGIQIAADADWRKYISQNINNDKEIGFSKPGLNRQLSIYNALLDIAKLHERVDTVFIHDAARPLLTQQMIDRCFASLENYDGVLPVLPMKDTVYYSEEGNSIDRLLDRSSIYAGQAPELFVFDKYMNANEKLMPDRIKSINGSTEPAVMAGMNIRMIPGDENNFKITTIDDLNRFKMIVGTKEK